MKRNILTKLIAAVIAIIPCTVSANPQAVCAFENDNLLMGERARLSISVPLPSDTSTVIFPQLQTAIKERKEYFSILNDTIEVQTEYRQALESQDNRYVMNYSMIVQAFDSGRYELPPFLFLVNGDSVFSNPVVLNVIPVKASADDQIEPFSDILPPFEIVSEDLLKQTEEKSYLLWWLIGVAVVIAALIIILYVQFRKTGRIFLLPRKPEPYEVALKNLQKLKEQNLPEKGKTKEYYTKLSAILRTYLHRQFEIKTLEKTTPEILAEVADNVRTSEFHDRLKSIFETSDFVKFAKVKPSEIENSKFMADAMKIVEESKPATEQKEKEYQIQQTPQMENRGTEEKEGGES